MMDETPVADEATTTADESAEADDPEPVAAGSPREESTDLELGQTAITAAARKNFDEEQALAIKRSVAKDCNDAEFVMFLEVCGRYQLDPFAKQVWAAKIGGAVTIMVSRDGLLQIANRNADFLGLTGDVIRKKDSFKKVYRQGKLEVEHVVEHGDPADRGEIVGAWALVEREGREPTYFHAPMSEYKGQNVWNKQPSAMILKCAESMALRKAYSISGIVGEDEVARRRSEEGAGAGLTGGLPYPQDDFGDRLRSLVRQANAAQPGAYRDAKVRQLLHDPAEFEKELLGFLRDQGVEPALDGEAVEVTDAAPDA